MESDGKERDGKAVTGSSVEVFILDLDRNDPGSDQQLLSTDEVERAQRFRFDRHRRRYVAGRVAMRRILGERAGIDPAALVFPTNEQGKPLLGPPSEGIAFNLSNSEAVGLLAVMEGPYVGADVEVIRTGFAGEDIARRFFAPDEVRRLLALAEHEREIAFFRCWTRKEALLKALGGGLSIPLRAFEVTLEPEVPARVLRLEPQWSPLRAADWTLVDVSEHVPGSVAAIAVPGPVAEIRVHQIVT